MIGSEANPSVTAKVARVFIVDDEPAVRRVLSRMIRSFGMVPETFGSAEEFLRRSPYEGNACILLDLRMPGFSGAELQAKLAEREDSPPIVFLTGYGDVPTSVAAIKRGAVDFLQKPVDHADVRRAVDEALAFDLRNRASLERRRSVQARVERLTRREREVMELVIVGMLNKQIALRLGISEKTVKIHRGRMMGKMAVRSVAELVRRCRIADIGASLPNRRH